MTTKIEWTEETWNPIVGCSKVSPGCNHCYAERMAKRLKTMGQGKYSGVVDDNGWTGRTYFADLTAINEPLKWKKPRTIFVCSMGDLFHKDVEFNWILKVMYMIDKCQQHTFLLLTKRPERMREFFQDWVPNPFCLDEGDLSNVWCGVTAENQEWADKRISILLDIPVAKRFVSIEPMLGPVNLTQINIDQDRTITHNVLTGIPYDWDYGEEFPENRIEKLDWVICGSESGPSRRPMDIDWVRNLKNQCFKSNVPFFFKQRYEGKKKLTLPELDGLVWDQKPQN